MKIIPMTVGNTVKPLMNEPYDLSIEEKEACRKAAEIMRRATFAKPNRNGTYRVDLSDLV